MSKTHPTNSNAAILRTKALSATSKLGALKSIDLRRLLVGGHLRDLGRFPRYFAFFLLGANILWAPILGYLSTAQKQFSSTASLILPGSGASASVNLNDIGQASSFANSAFSNGAISPTETYKRLLGADRVLQVAATSLGLDPLTMKKPRVSLVDQTSLMHIEVTSDSPQAAQKLGDALLAAFFQEIEALRQDEMHTRQASGSAAIADYKQSVRETRAEISLLQSQSGLLSADQYREQVTANDILQQKLRDLSGQVGQQSHKLRALESALGLPPNSAAMTLKLYADAQYVTLLEAVAEKSAAFAQARAVFGKRHPERVAAQDALWGAQFQARIRGEEVTGLRENELKGLDRAPEGQRASLLSDLVREHAIYEGLKQQYTTLTTKFKEEAKRLASLAPIAAELEDKQRDFSVAEAVFASAIARSESSKTDIYASYPLIQTLENPSRPDKPSSPNRKLAIIAGIAATALLMMGLLLAWLRQPFISRLLKTKDS